MFAQRSQNRSLVLLAAAFGSGLLYWSVGLPLRAQAEGPDPSTQLYVQDIGVVYWEVGGPKRLPIAFVYIVDGNGQPVNGALVAGDWSGGWRQRNDSALTQTICHTGEAGELVCEDGIARIEANKWVSCMKPCYITFTITSVSKQGMTYVPIEGNTSDTELCL